MKAATSALDAMAMVEGKTALMETAATTLRCDLDTLLESEQTMRSLKMLKKQKDIVHTSSEKMRMHRSIAYLHTSAHKTPTDMHAHSIYYNAKCGCS